MIDGGIFGISFRTFCDARVNKFAKACDAPSANEGNVSYMHRTMYANNNDDSIIDPLPLTIPYKHNPNVNVNNEPKSDDSSMSMVMGKT